MRPYNDDTPDAHYSGFRRLRPHSCQSAQVSVSHLDINVETDEKVETAEAVPCRRCNAQ